MTQNAVIKNVTLKNSRIKSNNISGGIIGSAGNTQIINCHTENVNIESGLVGGGIVGEAGVSYLDYIYNVHGEGDCYIVDCSASGSITSLNHLMGHYTGGIAGNIGVFSGVALVKDCVNRCQIEAYEDYNDGGIVGSKTKSLLILEDEMKSVAGNLYITTDDGSYGRSGMVTTTIQDLVNEGKKYDVCVAIGPMIMMKFVCKLTKELNIPTIVSLNSIMVDGTGMCGACRVTVGDEVKFAIGR